MKSLFRGLRQRQTRQELSWNADLPRSTRAATLGGVLIIALTFGGFGVWGSLAPIAGAVVAPGVFVATGENKTIQNLDGGVIKKILVHEGTIVHPGQTLIELDPTQPAAALRRLVLQEIQLSAEDAALQAEIREANDVNFPAELTAIMSDPEVRKVLTTQLLTFAARRNNLKSDIATVEASIKAVQDRIVGSKVQLDSVRRQIKLVQDEIGTKERLLTKGLVRKPDVQFLQRTQINLEGEVGRIMADIGDANERITRFEVQIKGIREQAIKKAVERLRDVRSQLADLNQRIRSARAVLDRITITSPVKGVVVKMRYHTEGGVIGAGKPIMEILPLGAQLIIEARVRPQDIDAVKYSKRAMVRLTALNQRVTPMIGGDVIYLSADTLPDEQKSQLVGPTDVYVVRIRLDPDEAGKISGFHPVPGMPAEVYIETEKRTFVEYLLKPVRDSMSRAFRER